MISSDANDHDAMLIHPEMFSGTRAHPTYSFGQYPYHNPQYNEMQANIVPDVTYHQQNIVSWPYSTNTKPYDDWIQQQQQPQNMSTTPSLPNQNYGSSCLPTSYHHHHHHLQRNQNDVQCANNGLMMPQDLVSSGSGPDGQTSPNSVVAVSSDGLSGSESPGCSVHPQGSLNRPQAARSPYEWMKKTSYQTQPNPGKTRTRDKYRMVYTDHQRLELEKEFHVTPFITMRRKTELAKTLGLSERQIKIWFQNRRAKGRRQAQKQHDIIQNDIRLMQTNHYSPFHFQAISDL